MIKVKNRTDLHAVAGTKPEKPPVDKMDGVNAAVLNFAESMKQTSELMAQSAQMQAKNSAEIARLTALMAEKKNIQLIGDVERTTEGKMKRIIISVKSAG